MTETEPKITLQVTWHLQIHRGIQNAAKCLKSSRKERLAKNNFDLHLLQQKIIMLCNYFQKALQFVWREYKYRRTFEYSRFLNMPRIMNVPRFRICQGL